MIGRRYHRCRNVVASVMGARGEEHLHGADARCLQLAESMTYFHDHFKHECAFQRDEMSF